MEDLDEYKALTSTLLAYYNFGKYQYQNLVAPRKLKIRALQRNDLALVPWYPKHIDNIHECIKMNESFTKNLALSVAADWGASADPSQWAEARPHDYDKVTSILLQIAREWSDDGLSEREQAFSKIVVEVALRYPALASRPHVKVLVPGCGTGRLVFEFVKQGFECQGNEFSYHMLLASNFILNHSFVPHNHSIFPFLAKFSHLAKRTNQIRPVTVPDINPLVVNQLQDELTEGIKYTELMSMTAGSFTELYGPSTIDQHEQSPAEQSAEPAQFRESNKNNFDVVATCFFLDTASNIIDYIRTIHHTLKSGGVWVNYGPLLWHFEDDASVSYVHRKDDEGRYETVPVSLKGLELSRDDLVELVVLMGFEIETAESGLSTGYSADPRLLGLFVYECEYWVARKK